VHRNARFLLRHEHRGRFLILKKLQKRFVEDIPTESPSLRENYFASWSVLYLESDASNAVSVR
jgi:hypothetical protein